MNKPVMGSSRNPRSFRIRSASLTVAIPVLSAMGIQVCPLPTSILSSQTSGFTDYSFSDLQIIWKK